MRTRTGTPPGERGARAPRLAGFAGAAAALGLTLALLTGIIRFLAGSAAVWEAELNRFAPPERTGLPEAEMPGMAAHIADYLAGRKESFRYTAAGPGGESRDCFHDYELVHMADCRGLIRLDETVCGISLAAALAGILLSALSGRAGRAAALRGAVWALRGFGAAAAALALWAAASFDSLFLAFHRIAFSNDLWLLNPRTDLLIRLMPVELFIDLGIRGLAAFTAGMLPPAAAVLACGRRIRRREAGAARET